MQFTAILSAALMAVAVSAQLQANPAPAAAIYDNPVGKR